MFKAWRAGLAAVVLLFGACPAWAEVAVPALKTRVTDLTATLTSDQQDSLEQQLAAFEARKGSQIAVLLVPTTQPETIEQYALRVAESWKLGRQGVDDGALLLVALKDHTLRIEVGYGLEGALNDATAKRIIEEIIVPHLKQGDYSTAIRAGVERMIAVVDGEPLPEPPSSPGKSGGDYGDWLITGAVLATVIGSVLRSLFGRLFGGVVTAGVVGFMVWLFLGSILIAVVVAIIVFFITLSDMADRRSHRSGGWSSGGGGGFSGGGGSFGGGGASGRW
ncbi:MAG: TPM domain-containing protein [Burkholderiales bacterium]